MPERRMNQPETAHSQMNRLRNRSDFSEGADGSRSLDNFNTPPQPSFDSEEMRGSMQAILAQNIGEYVVIEFLIGTENIVRKQGMLYFVGRSFVTLYDEKREQLHRLRHLLGEVCLLLHARRQAPVQLQPAAAHQRRARHERPAAVKSKKRRLPGGGPSFLAMKSPGNAGACFFLELIPSSRPGCP